MSAQKPRARQIAIYLVADYGGEWFSECEKEPRG